MLDDVTGSILFITAAPDSFTSFTRAQHEPVIICEANGAPVADLPIPVFSHKSNCMALVCKQKSQRHVLAMSHSVAGSCLAFASPLQLLSLSFVGQQVKLIHNHLCFLHLTE